MKAHEVFPVNYSSDNYLILFNPFPQVHEIFRHLKLVSSSHFTSLDMICGTTEIVTPCESELTLSSSHRKDIVVM